MLLLIPTDVAKIVIHESSAKSVSETSFNKIQSKIFEIEFKSLTYNISNNMLSQLPWVDEGRVEEALGGQDRVEVVAGEAPHERVIAGDEVVRKVPVKDDPVRAANPLQTEGQVSE